MGRKPTEDGGYKPKNWSTKTMVQLKKMAPQQRARYMAYEEPAKDAQESMTLSQKRIKDTKTQEHRFHIVETSEDMQERVKHSKLIGQLKAAEARNRIRIMRLRYQGMKSHEIKHLIACQPTSLKALRLEALVPPTSDNSNPGDALEKIERTRVEAILEDEKGLTTNRKLD